ncbi:hypothetical protein [Streptomyces sp. NPDC006333]|uniref:hypothetical protein n=1 Tax=Streptomyces sp. NPDC006333 TaxID=3156753 RepID=UPI0033B4A64E
MYDEEAARERFLQAGCSPEEADTLVNAGIDPDIVGAHARDAVGFASAAAFHDLPDLNHYLQAAGGDADEAFKQWTKDSVEGPLYEGQDDDAEADEGCDSEGKDETDGENARGVYGWVSAYITHVGAGEYSIELYDDLSLPGNAAYVDTLTFSVPATMPAGSPADRDAQVIKAATEELADYGCIPASDLQGSGDSFSVQVRASDHARQWLEDQRPPAEKLELLLAGLEGLVDDLTTTHPGRDRPCIDTIPHPHPGRPVTAPDGGARTSIVGWSDREAFLQAVAADVPDSVRLERYQGGWSKRLDGAEDLKHPRLRGLERVRAEAAQRDGELSGFTATFRSGDVVHHYQVSADWAQELDECLDDWEMRVRGAREEQTRFPHLKQWGQHLYQALVDDDQFMAAETPQDQDSTGGHLARSMFGPDCPIHSHDIQCALANARAKRADILLQRQRAQWQAAIPAGAAQLATSPGFQQGTTAQRAMLASNLLYAHHPMADTPDLSACCAPRLPTCWLETTRAQRIAGRARHRLFAEGGAASPAWNSA